MLLQKIYRKNSKMKTNLKVTKEELEAHLQKYFELGKLLSFEKLKKGLANNLYYLKTTKGEFTLKVAIRHNSKKINYEIDLLNALKNLPTPKPLKTKTGKYLSDFKQHKTFLYTFLMGNEKQEFNTRMLTQIGEFLGKLHLQTENFTSSIKRTEFYSVSKKILERVWQENNQSKNKKVREAILYLKNNALKYQLPNNLPTGAMHMDVKPENTLFVKSKLSGVVDFDNAYNGPLIFDLADTVIWFSSKEGRFNKKRARIILRGYQKVRKLNKKEKGNFPKALNGVVHGLVLHCLDYVSHQKLPEAYGIWVIDNLLETEKGLKFSEAELKKMLS